MACQDRFLSKGQQYLQSEAPTVYRCRLRYKVFLLDKSFEYLSGYESKHEYYELEAQFVKAQVKSMKAYPAILCKAPTWFLSIAAHRVSIYSVHVS